MRDESDTVSTVRYDVPTTGSTINAYDRALLKSGAAAVDGLTLARVVRAARGRASD